MGNDSPDTPVDSAAETPWGLAQRLADQGVPLATVQERLLEAGLPSEDAETLVRALRMRSVAGPGDKAAPGESPGLNMLVGIAKVGLGAGVLLADDELKGKQVLDGMLQVTAGFMGVRLDDGPVAPKMAPLESALPEVAPFQAADGAPRCQVHPQVVSVGTCPRCGALACYSCAPKKGLGGTELCAACERQPAVHRLRVGKAARHVALTLFAEAALLLALMLFAPLFGSSQNSGWGSIPYEAPLGLLFVVLGLMQWFVRHPGPGGVGSVVAGGLLPAAIVVSEEGVPPETLVLLLVPMAAILFTLDRLATRRKALRALSSAKAA